MALRDEITSDADALQAPSRAFEQLQKLSPDQWNRLMPALQQGDRTIAAKIFGATPQQMDDWFKTLKQKALDLVKSHPGLADPNKGIR